jgi:hypothetical protein
MNIFHVQIIGRNSIRDGVLRESLWLLHGIPVKSTLLAMSVIRGKGTSRCHELGVEFNWVITEFRYGDRFQALTSLW